MIRVKTAHELMSELFWPAFLEREGCIFLARNAPLAVVLDHILVDRTAVEAFYSHVHVLDLFRHAADSGTAEEPAYNEEHPDFRRGCDLAKTIARLWFLKLTTEFPDLPVRVYYTQADTPTVRFHSVHPNELPWLDETARADQVVDGSIIVYTNA